MKLFSRKKIRTTVLFIGLLQAASVSAQSLIEAYEAALKHDPSYRAAIYENEAGKQNKELGFSYLLPTLSASYSGSQNTSDITSPDRFGRKSTTNRKYNSMSAALQLRQPVFNLEAIARYYQGIEQTKYSEAKFAVQKQDLILRLVGAYADAKYAEDNLQMSIQQRDTFAEQQRANKRMFEMGEGTKTDMLETQAKLDLAKAQVLETEDNLRDARNALVAITGLKFTFLDGLRDDFKVKKLQPASFDEWKAIAQQQNPELIAQRHAVEAAYQEIRKNWAGHMPRLDLVASINVSKSDTTFTFEQEIKTNSLGFQLSIPLYSGGSTSALTSQAVSHHEQSKAEFEKTNSQVMIDLRKNYSLALSSELRINALEKSVSSAKLLVEATRKSVQAGVRTNHDVLSAQQQLLSAKRDLSKARYRYLLAYLRLRQGAGLIDANVLRDIASYFVAAK